jgi:hypothetical protein
MMLNYVVFSNSGLMGNNEFDAAKIDSNVELILFDTDHFLDFCENLMDVKAAWKKLVPYGF